MNGSADSQGIQALSAGSYHSELQQGIGFELVGQVPDDDGSLVTLSGEYPGNLSQLAIE